MKPDPATSTSPSRALSDETTGARRVHTSGFCRVASSPKLVVSPAAPERARPARLSARSSFCSRAAFVFGRLRFLVGPAPSEFARARALSRRSAGRAIPWPAVVSGRHPWLPVWLGWPGRGLPAPAFRSPRRSFRAPGSRGASLGAGARSVLFGCRGAARHLVLPLGRSGRAALGRCGPFSRRLRWRATRVPRARFFLRLPCSPLARVSVGSLGGVGWLHSTGHGGPRGGPRSLEPAGFARRRAGVAPSRTRWCSGVDPNE